MSKPIVTFTIKGNPIVKKNTQRVVGYGKAKRAIPSKAYVEWAREFHKQLGTKRLPDHMIDYPINLKCLFYKSTSGVVDMSALFEGIQDELKEAGVIIDDNCTIVAGHDGSRVYVDREDPRIEVTITAMLNYVHDSNPRPKRKRSDSPRSSRSRISTEF